MIAGNLKDCEKYYGVHPRLKDAFEFIKKYESEKPEGTKFEVDGKNLFAFTSDYVTRDLKDCEWETHDKYIDIQYVIDGEETMHWAGRGMLEPKFEYEEENDRIFYVDAPESIIRVKKGYFAIFFPEDIHRPCCYYDKPGNVIKMVVKIKVD